MRSLLLEVADKGAPAQAARARELLTQLDTPAGQEEAGLLIDAFLHDPYLTRVN